MAKQKVRAVLTATLDYEIDTDSENYKFANGDIAYAIASDKESFEDDPSAFFDMDDTVYEVVIQEGATPVSSQG